MARSSIRVDPSQFLARYVLGFVLIVAFVIGAHGLHLMTIRQGALDQEVINVSGRQRMLSQRITFLSYRYMETGAPRYGDLLVQSIDLFESGHNWVVSNAIPPKSDIEAMYMDVNGIDLDRRTKDFAALARGVFDAGPGTVEAAAIARQLEAIALTDLLVDLNGAVALFEAAANDRVSRMERIQLVALAFTILILLIEVLYIFYPAHKTMAGMIDRLRFQAWHDALTGLLNRARLISRLTSLAESKEQRLEDTFVVALDLDGFKTVNDTLGHPVGDQVLQRVATIIETQLEAQSQLVECGAARAGGDEFIVFGQVSSGDVHAVAQAFCDAVISEVEAPISVSLGNGRYETCYVGISAGVA
ncbi:MAG: diguanylate cyclase, partial [Pseudomonadota bacterium]